MSSPHKFERDLIFHDRNFPLDVMILEKHPDYPFVTHDFSQIVIVLHGTGINVVGKECFSLKAGDVFVLHGNRPHAYRETKNLSLINVIYDPSLLHRARFDVAGLPGYQALFVIEPTVPRTAGFDRHLQLGVQDLARAKSLAEAMEKELYGNGPRRRAVIFKDRHKARATPPSRTAREPGHRFVAMAHFMALVALVARCYTGQPISASGKVLGIGRAISYMERHFDEEVDLDELARMAGMSPRNFYRFFSLATSESPYSYLLRLRIRKGARLLQTTDKNVTEVAFECGYQDSSYFARQFRRAMGLSPRSFQRGFKAVPTIDLAGRRMPENAR